jgi:hydroxyacylglutathione hydrolase
MIALSNSIHVIKNKPLNTNTYVCIKEDIIFIVDPGLNVDELNRFLSSLSINQIIVLLTHGHFDHIGGASFVQNKYKCPVLIDKGDIPIAKMSNFLTKALGLEVGNIILPNFAFYEEIKLPSYTSINKIPGHTPGSVLIRIDDNFFSGDSLFEEYIIQNNLPGYDQVAHQKSIDWAKKNIGEKAKIWPGHGNLTRINKIYNYE